MLWPAAHWTQSRTMRRVWDDYRNNRSEAKGFISWGWESPNTCEFQPQVHTCSVASAVLDFATPWTVAHQAPLSTGFSNQEYCSGMPYPPLEDLPNSGIKPSSPASPALFTAEPLGSPSTVSSIVQNRSDCGENSKLSVNYEAQINFWYTFMFIFYC